MRIYVSNLVLIFGLLFSFFSQAQIINQDNTNYYTTENTLSKSNIASILENKFTENDPFQISEYKSRNDLVEAIISSYPCVGEYLVIHEDTITESGVYFDTLFSIHTLALEWHVEFMPTYNIDLDVTICEGDSYTFGDSSYTTAGTYTDSLTIAHPAYCDSIINLNLFISDPDATDISQEMCSGSSYMFGGIEYTMVGEYRDTLTSVYGCDSIIVLDLDTVSIDFDVDIMDVTLKSNQDDATYQWLTCTDNSPIPNAIQQTFQPTQNGDYRVVITYNNCSDTSSCETINNLGVEGHSESTLIKVYPNPFINTIQVSFNDYKEKDLQMVNTLGQVVYQTKTKKISEEINTEHLPSGVYFITIESVSGSVQYEIIKS